MMIGKSRCILFTTGICFQFLLSNFACAAFLTATESAGQHRLNTFIPKNYQKAIRPNYGGPPLDIITSLYIISITEISELNSTFRLNLYFRHHWTDPRLASVINKTAENANNKRNISFIVLDEMTTNRLWLPDTFISNAKEQTRFKMPFSGSKPASAAFTRVTAEGTVLRSVMLDVVASCQLDLEYFPFDKAVCSLVLESYSHTMDDLQYHWRNGRFAVGITSNIDPLGWAILGNTLQAKGYVKSFQSNRFKELSTELHLERVYRRFLIRCYLPAALQVTVALLFLALPVWAPKSLFLGHLCLLLYSIGFTLHNFNQLGTSHLTLLDSYLLTSLSAIVTCWLLSILELLYRPTSTSASGSRQPLLFLIERKMARWALPTLYLVYNLLHFASVYSTVTYHTGYENLLEVKARREAADGAAESFQRGSSHDALFV